MVIGIGLTSHNFRDAGAVGNGRHSGIAYKRINLSLGLEEEIPNPDSTVIAQEEPINREEIPAKSSQNDSFLEISDDDDEDSDDSGIKIDFE